MPQTSVEIALGSLLLICDQCLRRLAYGIPTITLVLCISQRAVCRRLATVAHLGQDQQILDRLAQRFRADGWGQDRDRAFAQRVVTIAQPQAMTRQPGGAQEGAEPFPVP